MTAEQMQAQIQAISENAKNQELAAWAEQMFTMCKNARTPFERQWYLNLAFYQGRHYVAPVTVAGEFKLTAPKSPAWRVRLVVNKIRTTVRTECSKLSGSRPIPTVVPATNEDEDFAAARVAEHLLESKFANAEFQKVYRNWIWWGSVTGTSYLKSYWDPTCEDTDMMQPAKPKMGAGGKPLVDAEGEPIYDIQQPVMGKICIERVTPFHIYVPDLLAEDINEQPFIIHCTTRSVDWIKEKFKFNAVADTRSANTIMESAFLLTKNAESVLDTVLVKEIWIKKGGHKDFPEGGVITVINGQVVQKKMKWPWPFPEYPFYKYDGIPTGSFYGDSIIVDLIPLNKEYNRTKSQMIEIKNTMGKPKIMAQQGSINPRMISSEPGQAIIYKAGYEKPVVLPAAEVPATMGMELDRLTSDFDDLSGQHEISRGGTPPQVTSGTAIAYLQEQDDTKLSYQIASIENSIEILGKHYLKYISTYWKEERLIKVAGKDSDFEAREWKGSDLRGNTDVKVQTGSALPVSKAAKQAMITEFMANGWLDPSIGMEMMSLGGFDKVLDEMLIDKKQAQRENLMMSKLDPEELMKFLTPPVGDDGEPLKGADGSNMNHDGTPWAPQPPIPVNSWDNHQAHIQYHNMFRKTQVFELLPPQIKHAIELHVQMHQQAITSPQQGQLGTVANDPNQPVVDPETGQVVPNPNAPQVDPNAEAAAMGNEQQLAQADESHQQDLSMKQESHAQAMEAAQQKTIQAAQKAKQEADIKRQQAELQRVAMIQKLNESNGGRKSSD